MEPMETTKVPEAPTESRPTRRRRYPVVNVLLFLATAASAVFAGAGLSGDVGSGSFGDVVVAGLPYGAAILGILLAHEMGHYLQARAWGVDSTLPYFIPMPFSFGTLGAVIRLRSKMPDRNAVLDIGAAGPIAGLVVALPLYVWGVIHSEVHAVPEMVATNTTSLWSILVAKLHGEALVWGGGPDGTMVFGDSLLTWGLEKLIIGTPPPGQDVFVHPVALAAWLGLFITTLNLIPIGQLDGGHVTYALLGGERAHRASRWLSWALFAAGVFVSL
ncbi:MAG TPA: site-2 protease family protein, partial [Anaeromyxobacteraceae bacterium]|nr:site-2 protease family protein [Anaeromyxobacteraceae bacterium]